MKQRGLFQLAFQTIKNNTFFNLTKLSQKTFNFNYDLNHQRIFQNSLFNFSTQKPTQQIGINLQTPQPTTQANESNIQVQHEQATVGGQKVDFFKTKGAFSILDKVQGTKQTNSGQLYILHFTCTKCNQKNIRSFTKQAYHKGVVLIRCGGCQNIHLVADNLGWFSNEVVNVETMHGQTIKKVHDPVAITKFLNKAFEEDKKEDEIVGNEEQKK